MDWQLPPYLEIPPEFIAAVRKYKPTINGKYAARLLWQRGIREIERLPGYLNSDRYQPSSPFEFGTEMRLAVERLNRAYGQGEKVTIWGDFDADGVTATSVLWDGLGQFFTQGSQLNYYIPDRLKESHGLNIPGIGKLAETGTNLIVTCDTGSTNIQEIEYAHSLGIDIIVTDHHTLPPDRPSVVAIINPRYLDLSHPLYHLSGVAVAYKLVEALYETLPQIPQQPVEYLLDLVAIGLIADLVQLSGDCRYLAQRGIQRLTAQNNPGIDGFRPGVHKLLNLCKRNGDRPTDISFGIAPRINAISRIHGDASFGVELLTSKDADRCHDLAAETELANTRRKELQKNVTQQVQNKLAEIDLSTTSVIVLVDANWSPGVLGLVAGQIAQEYGKPTILLSTVMENSEGEYLPTQIARGSARSANNIDLYQLVNSQSHLLNSFGGHPFAAGLSINVNNIPLFIEAINHQLRCTIGELPPPSIATDLVVTMAEVVAGGGRDLFEELLCLEPYGMGNPVPKLLIKNCQFKEVKNSNIQDFKGNKIQYIRTKFELLDRTHPSSFPGVWWGHYQQEIPQVATDAIVELDFNSYQKRCEVRLIDVRPAIGDNRPVEARNYRLEIIDLRQGGSFEAELDLTTIWVRQCPKNWHELQSYGQQAIHTNQKLALSYQEMDLPSIDDICYQFIGIAKYLARTATAYPIDKIKSQLYLGDISFKLGLTMLEELGFKLSIESKSLELKIEINSDYLDPNIDLNHLPIVRDFKTAIAAERFNYKYFTTIPVYTIKSVISPGC
jgi:single-stranded-DNA-specific exonuclease